jgi:subtilisin family serine protease
MEKEYVIGLHRGVDTDQFWQDMETITNLDGIPNRQVEVANRRIGSNRLTHYFLTDEEAELVKQDKRVYCVEIPADQRDDISIGLNAIQTENFTKANDYDGNLYVDATGSAKNWGLLRSRYLTNNYGTSLDVSGSYFYTLDGTGVDVVIQDSGIQSNHPEFQDENGISRIKEIEWYSAAGITGSYQGSGFYSDYDGHGTHVAAIAVGKTFGFAKNANIYSQKLAGLEGSSDPGSGIPISTAFDTIRLWHLNKSGSRPTIVNMSWGYGTDLSAGGITNVNYRGTNYTSSSNIQEEFGIASYSATETWRINTRVASVDVEIQEMIDAGIHICIAAGNLNYKCEVSGGIDYDNYFTKGGTDYYYHRGSSPYDDEAFLVGSISYNSYDATTDQKSNFSNAGPAVNIYAPGHFIMSAESDIANSNHTTASYYDDNRFKQAILSGTSQASPQVAGSAALALQVSPKTSVKSLREFIVGKTGDVLLTGSADDYTSDSTMGGEPRILYNSFGQDPSPGTFDGQNINFTSTYRIPTDIRNASNKIFFPNTISYNYIASWPYYRIGATTYTLDNIKSVSSNTSTQTLKTLDDLTSFTLESGSFTPGIFPNITYSISGSSAGISTSTQNLNLYRQGNNTTINGTSLKYLSVDKSGYQSKATMLTSIDGTNWTIDTQWGTAASYYNPVDEKVEYYPNNLTDYAFQYLGAVPYSDFYPTLEFLLLDATWGNQPTLYLNWGYGWAPFVYSRISKNGTALLSYNNEYIILSDKNGSYFRMFKMKFDSFTPTNSYLSSWNFLSFRESTQPLNYEYKTSSGNNSNGSSYYYGGIRINSSDQALIGGPISSSLFLQDLNDNHDNYYFSVENLENLYNDVRGIGNVKLHVYDYGEPHRDSNTGEHIGAIGSSGDTWYFSLSKSGSYYGRIIRSTGDPFAASSTQHPSTYKIEPDTNWEVIEWGSTDSKFDHHFFMTGSNNSGFFYGSGGVTRINLPAENGYNYYPNLDITADTVYPIKTLTTKNNKLSNLVSSSYTTGSMPTSNNIWDSGIFNIINDGSSLYSIVPAQGFPNTGSLNISNDSGNTWTTYPLTMNNGLLSGISKYKDTFYLRPYINDNSTIYYTNNISSNSWTQLDFDDTFGGEYGNGFEYFSDRFYASTQTGYIFNLTKENSKLEFGWSLPKSTPLAAGTKRKSRGVTISPNYYPTFFDNYVNNGLYRSIDNGYNFTKILDPNKKFTSVETDGKGNWIALTINNTYYFSIDNGKIWETKNISYNGQKDHYYSDVIYINGKWVFSPSRLTNTSFDGDRKLISTLNPFKVRVSWKIEETFNEDIYNMWVLNNSLILKGHTHHYKMTIS